MSTINQRIVNELAEIEYRIRDGLVLSDEQKEQVKLLADQLIGLMVD